MHVFRRDLVRLQPWVLIALGVGCLFLTVVLFGAETPCMYSGPNPAEHRAECVVGQFKFLAVTYTVLALGLMWLARGIYCSIRRQD